MNRTKKVFQDIYNSRRKIFVVLAIMMIIPVFQNCAGGFSSSSSEAAGAGAFGTGPTSPGGPSSPTPQPPGNTGPSLDDIQKACKAVISTPSLGAPSVGSVTVKSGLGSTDSGD